MMEAGTLEKKIAKLPENLKKRAEGYIDALLEEVVADKEHALENDELVNKKKLKREFGGLNGFITYIADDFDAPLDEFKDYM